MQWIKYLSVALLALIAGLVIASFAAKQAMPRVMFKEVVSPLDHEQTLATIRERVLAQPGWAIVTEIDQRAAILAGGGDDIGPYDIVKICNGGYATRMLGDENRAYFGVMLPISVAVYERDDGRTYVSLLNGDVVAKVFGQQYVNVVEDVRYDMEIIFRFLHLSFDIMA